VGKILCELPYSSQRTSSTEHASNTDYASEEIGDQGGNSSITRMLLAVYLNDLITYLDPAPKPAQLCFLRSFRSPMARFVNILLCLFLFAHLIAISSTTPTHHSIDTPSPGASLARHKPQALAPHNIPQTPSALARRETTSVRRADDTWIISYLDGGKWKLWFTVFQGCLRIANAATVLEHFLGTVIDRAEGIWLADDPVNAFTVEIGMLVLQFRCDIPIPWGFIGWVAERLLHRVSLGFVGTFKAMVEHLTTRKMVHVNLKRIVDVAAAA